MTKREYLKERLKRINEVINPALIDVLTPVAFGAAHDVVKLGKSAASKLRWRKKSKDYGTGKPIKPKGMLRKGAEAVDTFVSAGTPTELKLLKTAPERTISGSAAKYAAYRGKQLLKKGASKTAELSKKGAKTAIETLKRRKREKGPPTLEKSKKELEKKQGRPGERHGIDISKFEKEEKKREKQGWGPPGVTKAPPIEPGRVKAGRKHMGKGVKGLAKEIGYTGKPIIPKTMIAPRLPIPTDQAIDAIKHGLKKLKKGKTLTKPKKETRKQMVANTELRKRLEKIKAKRELGKGERVTFKRKELPGEERIVHIKKKPEEKRSLLKKKLKTIVKK